MWTTCTPQVGPSASPTARAPPTQADAGAQLVQRLAEDQVCQKAKCCRAMTLVLLLNNDSKIM